MRLVPAGLHMRGLRAYLRTPPTISRLDSTACIRGLSVHITDAQLVGYDSRRIAGIRDESGAVGKPRRLSECVNAYQLLREGGLASFDNTVHTFHNTIVAW